MRYTYYVARIVRRRRRRWPSKHTYIGIRYIILRSSYAAAGPEAQESILSLLHKIKYLSRKPIYTHPCIIWTTISSAATKSKKYQKRFTSCQPPYPVGHSKRKKCSWAIYIYLGWSTTVILYYWSNVPQYMQTVATAMLIYDAGKEDLWPV